MPSGIDTSGRATSFLDGQRVTPDRLRGDAGTHGGDGERSPEHPGPGGSERLRRFEDEHAALQRLATLVAEEATAGELFAVVCEEAARVLEVPGVTIGRYDADGSTTVLATSGDIEVWARAGFEVGSRWPLDGPSVARRVLDTGLPATISHYSQLSGTIAASVRPAPNPSWVGVPITVEGKTWGVVCACTSGITRADLPVGIESQLARFTKLVATAVSNAQARDDLRSLADEQAALRRIATLVARGPESRAVFDAICTETCQLVGASSTNLAQFTADGGHMIVAGSSQSDPHLPTGTRIRVGTDSVSAIVVRTAAPARLDRDKDATSELAMLGRDRCIRSAVAAPILVEGGLWGAVIAGRDATQPFRVGDEERVARFAELAATAISNAAARSELMASRARIVAADDEARRRIGRNLHDGVQQDLLALALNARGLLDTVPAEQQELRAGLVRLGQDLETVLEDVRDVSRGLHPAMLAVTGLRSALTGIARKSPIPVSLQIDTSERAPGSIETAIYYVVSEALVNAARHSGASAISVTVTNVGAALLATIDDDGVGGADPRAGSGITGLIDRVEALGGTLALDSPAGRGTRISIEFAPHPLAAAA
jgi:signal transduction histidine kinase